MKNVSGKTSKNIRKDYFLKQMEDCVFYVRRGDIHLDSSFEVK